MQLQDFSTTGTFFRKSAILFLTPLKQITVSSLPTQNKFGYLITPQGRGLITGWVGKTLLNP